LGPIYETTLKKMPWSPQGLERIGEWKARFPCPLVAIGGITLANAPQLLDAGADSLAVLSTLFDAPDIRTAAHDLNQLFATESEE